MSHYFAIDQQLDLETKKTTLSITWDDKTWHALPPLSAAELLKMRTAINQAYKHLIVDCWEKP